MDLGPTITNAADRLRDLTVRYRGIMGYVDSNHVESLEALRDLAAEVAEIVDPILFGIACEVNVNSSDMASGKLYSGKIVATAITEGPFELTGEIDNAIEELGQARDPNEEHRLGARQLGVGRAA